MQFFQQLATKMWKPKKLQPPVEVRARVFMFVFLAEGKRSLVEVYQVKTSKMTGSSFAFKEIFFWDYILQVVSFRGEVGLKASSRTFDAHYRCLAGHRGRALGRQRAGGRMRWSGGLLVRSI